MTEAFGPQRWAVQLTTLLNAAYGLDHFPIDVPAIARDYSAQRFPGDAITLVKGDNLPGFDGALYRAPAGKTGWGIVYNSAITSCGRINFTLAHELGHYLLHRMRFPKGIQCGEQDIVRWDSEYGQIEHQANQFAAYLLMPFDDFRRQIDPKARIDLDAISHCADRYRVSLIAAILRWLDYTERRAVLVVSRDDFILWSRASGPALKTRAFFRTSRGPIEIPPESLAATRDLLTDGRTGVLHAPGVWFPEEVREMTIFSERYDFVVTLLLLEDAGRYIPSDHEPEEDTFDRLTRGL
jgi:hypothetical protein